MSIGRFLKGFHHRNKKNPEALKFFFLREVDSSGVKLNKFVSFIAENMIGLSDFRIAILYEYVQEHTSPLLIEIIDHKMKIYSTDCRAFDVVEGFDNAHVIRDLTRLDPSIEVFIVDAITNPAVTSVIRQYQNVGCALFSAIDLEIMLRVKTMSIFFRDYIQPANQERLFTFSSLPPSMMLYTQCIQGKERKVTPVDDSVIVERKGLKHYLQERPATADLMFRFENNPPISLECFFSWDGYSSLVNGLVTPLSFPEVETIVPGADSLEGEVLFFNHAISLKSLYDWLMNQEKDNQRSFMMKVFEKMYSAFESQEQDSCYFKSYDVFNLALIDNIAGVEWIKQHAIHWERWLQTDASISNSRSQTPSQEPRNLFYRTLSELATTVLGNTPIRIKVEQVGLEALMPGNLIPAESFTPQLISPPKFVQNDRVTPLVDLSVSFETKKHEWGGVINQSFFQPAGRPSPLLNDVGSPARIS